MVYDEFDKDYKEAVDRLEPSSELINRLMMNEERKVVKLNKKKIVILTLAACMLVGTTALAATGKITGYFSSSNAFSEISDYAKLDKLEKEVGGNINLPETFENGYKFEGASTGDVNAVDDADNVVAQAKQLVVEYANADEPVLNVYVAPLLEELDGPMGKTTDINGVTVDHFDITFKFVPLDYELTEQDKADMESGKIEISYGSNDIVVQHSVGVCFVKDNMYYDIFAWDSTMTEAEWLAIAEKIIAQ